MRRYRLIRLFLCVLVGLIISVLGILLLDRPPSLNQDSFDLLSGVRDIFGLSILPAAALIYIGQIFGLLPVGESAKNLIQISIVGLWVIYSLAIGLFVELLISICKTHHDKQPDQHLPLIKRIRLYIKNNILASILITSLILIICGYFIKKEVALYKERDYFVNQIDHEAVAKACLNLLIKLEKSNQYYSDYSGFDPINNPNVPEIIRNLEPKRFTAGGSGCTESVHISRNKCTFLIFEHPYGELDRYILVYQEGSSSKDHRTILYTIKNPSKSQENIKHTNYAKSQIQIQIDRSELTPMSTTHTSSSTGKTHQQSSFNLFLNIFQDGNVKIVPHFEEGEPNGFKLKNVNEGSYAYKIGLRSEDVLKSVNNLPMNTPEGFLQAGQACENKSKIIINVERDNSIVSIDISLNK